MRPQSRKVAHSNMHKFGKKITDSLSRRENTLGKILTGGNAQDDLQCFFSEGTMVLARGTSLNYVLDSQ